MKFSIIIPVYNVEEYLDKCLKSIKEQTYKNFEVIIVNDGTKDNSQKIIDKYEKLDKRFKGYIKENGGLSSARNYGLQYIKGDYILFIDSDDYIAKDLLNELNKTLTEKQVDLVRFNALVCDINGQIFSKSNDIEYLDKPVDEIIGDLTRRAFVEPAWLYCYRTSFWQEHNFKYPIGRIHEDYGLTPLILYYAQSITSINYNGYYYVMRDGSITKTKNYEKIKKAAMDFIWEYEEMIKVLDKKPSSVRKDYLLTYISECVIMKGSCLNKEDFKIYNNKLKELSVAKRIKPLNSKKLIKKIIASLNYKIYIKVFNK